ncbi:M1 family aminopeptidase [Roseivirga sp.]|uniref:M1 family aminopeptidase n=1 Tax=Roseivirga sp. TaxID=1964215 RepID=UPI003B52F337
MPKIRLLTTLMLLFLSGELLSQQLDVLSYEATIEPDISAKSIKGSVLIKYSLPLSENSFELESGNLEVIKVEGAHVKAFENTRGKLQIQLQQRQATTGEIRIEYRGRPDRGLLFNQEKNQAYTVYFTSSWMVNHFPVNDKARINLNIVVDKDLDCIANGKLLDIEEKEGKNIYHWQQDFDSPAYTYGFTIGSFDKLELSVGETQVINYAKGYTADELKVIFRETASILSFMEDKSGIRFDYPSYSQVLIGNHFQEMSGFSVLRESYGRMILKDSTETNLISHELAHQWWGNRISCETWGDIWLNEGMATYLSAAYNLERFGRAKYKSDINSYMRVYQDIKKRNKDKPLVFENWLNPTADDRNLVYFKGAYVLHLLREELGNEAFWKGIKLYSQKHFDSSVSTQDFKLAMEEASGKKLNEFFNEWIF